MRERLTRIARMLLHIFPGSVFVNWDTWAECYDYGKDKWFFLRKSLCQCKHRDYSHRIGNYKIPVTMADLERTLGCNVCSCKEFRAMDNLDWLAYSNERVPDIEANSKKDYYDYFTAVAKGEKDS